MIAEILNRDFVLGQLADIRRVMESQATSTRRSLTAGPEGAEALTPDDYAAAADMAAEALANETQATSGQAGFAAPESTRRGMPAEEPAPSIDERSFFSRDPVISLFQSVLEEYLETREPEVIAEAEPASASRGASLTATPHVPLVTERRLVQPEQEGRDRLFEQFSVTDPGWVSQLFAQALTRLRGKRDFNPQPATQRPLQDRTRLLLVGDWGTGIARAQKVADQMRQHLDRGKAEGVEQTAIHLGDIYYAGRKREVNNRFLRYWPVQADEADQIASYSTNANHDMYSGGHAYYDVLLGDPRFAAQEKSSFFSLANAHWRILGLDTAWEEKDLQAPQPEWIREQARQAKEAGQKLLFLSHHQLFTVYEREHDKIAGALESIGSPEIQAWFWGHEHRCMTFDPHLNVQYPSCVGHGGVPVYMKHEEDDPYPAPGKWEYRDFILDPNGKERWGYMGFASVDLDGPKATVTYVNEDGLPHHTDTIVG
ncbi:MAG: metallophosphoesterase [Acidobacteriota bacterium]